jgi:hypothetical protein
MPQTFLQKTRIALTCISVMAPMTTVAQTTVLKLIGSDSVPIPYAWISIQGGNASITDSRGELNLGPAHRATLTLDARRIGYQPWFGTIETPDTASVLTVTLLRVAQKLPSVKVTSVAQKGGLELKGFYDRWLDRQKGLLTAEFIGPEEIEKRHPGRTSDLLSGRLGVSMNRSNTEAMVAKNAAGTCFMTILVDGVVQCPVFGCHTSAMTSQNVPQLAPTPHFGKDSSMDDITVDIDRYVSPGDVAAIEIYARGGNMPLSLQTSDAACGVIAIWTGRRK